MLFLFVVLWGHFWVCTSRCFSWLLIISAKILFIDQRLSEPQIYPRSRKKHILSSSPIYKVQHLPFASVIICRLINLRIWHFSGCDWTSFQLGFSIESHKMFQNQIYLQVPSFLSQPPPLSYFRQRYEYSEN